MNPEQKYLEAQKRAKRASELCPHWTTEEHGNPIENPCCREYYEALQARKHARMNLAKAAGK